MRRKDSGNGASGNRRSSDHSNVSSASKLMNAISEEKSGDFSTDLAFEFADDDDDSDDGASNENNAISGDGGTGDVGGNSTAGDDDDDSISLGLGGAEDDLNGLGPETASESLSDDDHHEGRAISNGSPNGGKRKKQQEASLTEKIQQRTGRVKLFTWGFLVLLAVSIPLLSIFMTRSEDCREQKDEVRLTNGKEREREKECIVYSWFLVCRVKSIP